MKFEIVETKDFSPIHLNIEINSAYELIELVGLFGAGIAKTRDVLSNYEDTIDCSKFGQFTKVYEELHNITKRMNILHMNYKR